MRRKEEENIKEGFNIATVTKAKIKLLIYSEKLPDGKNLVLRTSSISYELLINMR